MPESRPAAQSPLGDSALKFDPETSRLLDVARTEFIAHGIRRASISDIARRAGVSRPTLFRRCGDKNDIVTAVAVRDLVGFFARAKAVVESEQSLEGKITEAFVLGMRQAREHPMVKALIEFDDPSLAQNLLGANSGSYRMMINAIVNLVNDDHSYPSAAIEQALEISLRLTATLIASPMATLPTESDDNAREFARRYIVAILHAALQ
ncbi:TetR/AcrR family transcriptional regulator [Mycobacteroides abscessus]|uniref:TetR/AcrR family transcriptional regulator n=1 Tax=Mycobacteroides abscessus TaxID=36809 RepID=UPI0009287188|nr:TetR/AcrR family transcriptional regulator [Mycobacteroides abscessus]SHR28201.1 Putative transcriptional regulator, TetR family [Mycobacteroides abscessus subsp. bolletii]SHT28264.1 Putative transcriptional regulator, TetR family [Mycobacteroides abscessus subsp. bolletii]SHT46927.1 Putative transcriptional regulator, TetR family [Mycobacteroides abscessus subsp. bolletii]SKG59301.1 Putative transcriptional regulator, TetR family [Mycobacteroides abscessus subsp. bolletii]SKH15647.1 Putati